MKVENLEINELIKESLFEKKYEELTDIQEKAIPNILEGDDLIGIAQTGTGKTAAFSLPILHKLSQEESNKIKCLVLVPTRELAVQIGEDIEEYGKYTTVKTGAMFGGITPKRHIKVLKREPNILVSTIGRLQYMIEHDHIDLSHVKYLVLDEADRMLDLGIIKDVRRIISKLPQKRQNILFSATMPDGILKLTRSFVNNPSYVRVRPKEEEKKTIEQRVYRVSEPKKGELLTHLLTNMEFDSVIVFVRTKKRADKVSKALSIANIRSKAIHSDKNQVERQKVLNMFKSKEIKVLVATDVAARGLDIDNISYVFNLNIPKVSEEYIHRIGRTGRAKKHGIAISFCSRDELEYLRSVERLQNHRIQVINDHPFEGK